MGHGIAQEFALSGYQVRLHDQNLELIEVARDKIRSNLHRLSTLGLVHTDRIEPTLSTITATPRLVDAVTGAELIIEAIFEDLAAKHALFRSLSGLCAPETIIASNTSSFMPSRLAEAVEHPQRLLVAHYFNPPYLIPIVEVVPGTATSERTIDTMLQLLRKAGKKPILIRKESPGFVANRLQFALFREAISVVEQGIADPADVDQVVKYGFGRRLAAAGPFEIFDLAGLDTIQSVASQILPELASVRDTQRPVPELLSRKVERGELGVKTGRGFHEWTPETEEELRNRLIRALVEAERSRWRLRHESGSR
jgi:3-hydroxybutyryl-CoA dehydrogenase